MALLEQISKSPYPESATSAIPMPQTGWQRVGIDRILYVFLALALLLGLLLPIVTMPFQTTTPNVRGATELGALLDSLDAEDVALVAYEWGAQRSSELRPLEQALISRLIADRTRMILLSTDMQGTLLSFDLIGPLREAGYNNENGITFGGRDYVLLGYRPGGDLALRSIAQDLRGELTSDFRGRDATESLVANTPDGQPRFASINDLSLIVVMADTSQDVQAWMEQVRPAAPDVPFVFLLPQETLPLVQPYLRQEGIYFSAGQHGALALQANDPGADLSAISHATGQLNYAVVVFVVLLLVGALFELIVHRGTGQGGTHER